MLLIYFFYEDVKQITGFYSWLKHLKVYCLFLKLQPYFKLGICSWIFLSGGHTLKVSSKHIMCVFLIKIFNSQTLFFLVYVRAVFLLPNCSISCCCCCSYISGIVWNQWKGVCVMSTLCMRLYVHHWTKVGATHWKPAPVSYINSHSSRWRPLRPFREHCQIHVYLYNKEKLHLFSFVFSCYCISKNAYHTFFFFFSYPASVHVSYCGTLCSFQIERGFLYCLLHWFFGGVWNFIWHAKCFRFLVVYGQNIFRLTLQKWEARSFMGGVYVAVAVSTSVYGLCLCVPGLINKEMLGGKLCWMNKTTSLYCWSDVYNHLQWWQLIKCKESVICCPFVDAS